MRWMKGLLVVVPILTFASAGAAQAKLKVGFIYVGPIGDYGWTHAHDQARLIAAKKLGVETIYVERGPCVDQATGRRRRSMTSAAVHENCNPPNPAPV